MRFNKIIKELKETLNKPDIHLKTFSYVVEIFFNSMSKQEQEVFLRRCSNLSFDLYKSLNLKTKQVSLIYWFKFIKKLKYDG